MYEGTLSHTNTHYMHTQVCLYFDKEDYEGLDPCYTLIDGVLRDGDGDEINLVSPIIPNIQVSVGEVDDDLVDPELQELEEDGGGYLSDSDDDDFLFGGDGDKKIVKD